MNFWYFYPNIQPYICTQNKTTPHNMEQLNELESTLLNGLIQKYPTLKSHIPYLKVKERKNLIKNKNHQ